MMDIGELTISQAREIARMFGFVPTQSELAPINSGLIGKYVIVRCTDAGVHAGVLEAHNGRECVLLDSRRLWYWKPDNGQKFLSGVALVGLHEDSKVAAPLPRILLTENCEIILCTVVAEKSIRSAKIDEK